MKTNITPKVSVIMGIYNCGTTLQEALDSLYAQTYQDFEIILCDDGSSDNTHQIAYENQQKHTNIVLLKNSYNMGLNQTLNICLAVAKGEYCARMDGDDVCDPTRFEKQVAFLDQNPDFALVGSGRYLFDENGKWGEMSCIEFPTVKDVLTHVPCFCHPSIMMRTEVYRAVGGYSVEDRLIRVEDCHLWFKVYSKGYKGANLLEPLHSMRDDRNAISRRTWKARRNGIYVMYCGYKMFKLPWFSYIRLIKLSIMEIAKYLMPMPVYEYLHRKNRSLCLK